MEEVKTRAVSALERLRRRFAAGFWTRRMMRSYAPVRDGQFAYCFVGGLQKETSNDTAAFRFAHEAFRRAAQSDPMRYNDHHYTAKPIIEKIDEAVQLIKSGALDSELVRATIYS